MTQILHIFRKDARRHWPEILVSLVLIAVFVWYQPRKWTGQAISIRFVAGLLNILPALLVLSWAFLIARLVQGELLVGDRQFWITRPYDWYKLLASKLLILDYAPLRLVQTPRVEIIVYPSVHSSSAVHRPNRIAEDG